MHFYFFSFGSNLLFERIRNRTPSVEVIREYRLDQFELVFNKLSSTDGSIKANISRSKQSHVHGVIHRINENEKVDLDRAECLGYGYELEFFELLIYNKLVKVGYYIAKDPKYLSAGKPFDWYLNYVKFGAQENGFPLDYQQQIQSVEFVIDTNENRRKKHDPILTKYQ